MPQQIIYLGIVPNDGLGTPLRNAGSMINSNFTELYAGTTPSQVGNAGRVLTTNGSTLSWSANLAGTVISVGATGSNGVSVAGSPITSTGSLTIGLDDITPASVAALGTVTGSNLSGTNTGDQTLDEILPPQAGNAGRLLGTDGTTASWVAEGAVGSVLSVDISSPNSTVTVGGGPITTSGFLTVDLPATGVIAGSYSVADIVVDDFGRITSATNGTAGTVTDIDIISNDGITSSGGPVTTSGNITIGLGDITPLTVTATGNITGANLSGINSGDQVITLTGDVTGSGTDSFAATLSDTGVTPGLYVGANVTVDAKGRITNIADGPEGTVTDIDIISNDGITSSGGPVTTSGNITIGLGDITPLTVTATGDVTGANLSGTNTGDQTITLTGDVTGSGTDSFVATLSDTAVTPGSYTNATFTVDAKGRITSASSLVSGTAVLTAGTVTVSATSITGGSIVMLTIQALGTVTVPQAVYVSAVSVGVGFDITSAAASDTSTIGWIIIN